MWKQYKWVSSSLTRTNKSTDCEVQIAQMSVVAFLSGCPSRAINALPAEFIKGINASRRIISPLRMSRAARAFKVINSLVPPSLPRADAWTAEARALFVHIS